MNHYFDKDGTSIELMDWAKLIENKDYCRIDETTLANGSWVSTVWLGANHQYAGGPPLIFETMVFPLENVVDKQDMERYSTLKEAQAGHARMVAKWTP